MTVSSSTSRADYDGNGVTVAFTVPFYFLDASHLAVYSTDTSTGATTTLAITTDYTVTGAGSGSGGTVTTVAAPAVGKRITVLRSIPISQLTRYVENDPFPARSHEGALDKMTMLLQQQQEEIGRALKLPVAEDDPGDLPAAGDRLDRMLGFSAANGAAQMTAFTMSQLAAVIAANHAAASSLLVITAEAFGAVGDGVTDDTAALTNAWNTAIAARCTLELGAKKYLIKSPMPTITAPCWIKGQGAQKTWIVYDKSASGNAITTRNVWLGASSAERLDPNGDTFTPAGDMTGAKITGFSLLGDRSTSNTQGGLIHVDRADNLIVDDIEVDNIKGVGWGFAEGASANALCRESTIGRIEVRRCGDQATGRPGVHILTTGSAGADATNEVSIQHLLSVWNDGCALKLENRNALAARFVYIKQCMLHGRDSAGGNPMTEPMLQVVGDWYAWGIEDMEMNGVRDGVWGIVMDRDPTTLLFPRIGKIHGSIGVKSGSTGNGVWIKYGRNLEFVVRDIAGAATHLQLDGTVSGPIEWDTVGNDSTWTYVFANTTTRDRLVRTNIGWQTKNPNDTNGYTAQFKAGPTAGEPALTQVTSTASGTRDVIRYRAAGFAEMPYGYKLAAMDPADATDDPFRAYREARGSESYWVFQSGGFASRKAVSWGSATPADGTHLKGDRRYNDNPAVGSPKSWVCTVAGTPGTWVSEGNL